MDDLEREDFGVLKRDEDKVVISPNLRQNITLIDKTNNAYPWQKELLQNCASLDFGMGGYESLASMLNTLGVKVIISNEKATIVLGDYLKKAKAYWALKKKSADQSEKRKANKVVELIGEENNQEIPLLGRYFSKRKVIELYPYNMSIYDMQHLLITTLVHESMHAYFDRPRHKAYPYAYFVEEPLAEFGMLIFFERNDHRITDNRYNDTLVNWARNHIQKKSNCYRFGATLFEQYRTWNPALRKQLEEYKYPINEFEMLDIANDESAVAIPFPDQTWTTEWHSM